MDSQDVGGWIGIGRRTMWDGMPSAELGSTQKDDQLFLDRGWDPTVSDVHEVNGSLSSPPPSLSVRVPCSPPLPVQHHAINVSGPGECLSPQAPPDARRSYDYLSTD